MSPRALRGATAERAGVPANTGRDREPIGSRELLARERVTHAPGDRIDRGCHRHDSVPDAEEGRRPLPLVGTRARALSVGGGTRAGHGCRAHRRGPATRTPSHTTHTLGDVERQRPLLHDIWICPCLRSFLILGVELVVASPYAGAALISFCIESARVTRQALCTRMPPGAIGNAYCPQEACSCPFHWRSLDGVGGCPGGEEEAEGVEGPIDGKSTRQGEKKSPRAASKVSWPLQTGVARSGRSIRSRLDCHRSGNESDTLLRANSALALTLWSPRVQGGHLRRLETTRAVLRTQTSRAARRSSMKVSLRFPKRRFPGRAGMRCYKQGVKPGRVRHGLQKMGKARG
jgi:hypothetical protein